MASGGDAAGPALGLRENWQQFALLVLVNEFAGCLAVALTALATGVIASRYGLRPEPFYLGIAFAAVGLALSMLLVRETTGHAIRKVSTRVGVHRWLDAILDV